MLRLTFAFLMVRSSALALQPALGRSTATIRSAAAVRSAAFMQVDWEAREEAKKKAEAEAHAKLLAHLRAPIRQYEGGWGDTALRGGGKDQNRFGTGPDGNLGKDFTEVGKEIPDEVRDFARITSDGRRKTKSSAATTLPPEKQEQLVLPEESFKVTKMEMSQTDEDLVIECNLGDGETEAELVIDIEPLFLTREEYFYGFTANSDPKISIEHADSSEIEGELEPKDHAAKRDGTATSFGDESWGGETEDKGVKIKLKFKPESSVGEFDAYLCFMFPNEKQFSKFYKITGKSTSDDETTRDTEPSTSDPKSIDEGETLSDYLAKK